MIQIYKRLRDESRIPWFLFYAGLTIELLMVIIDKSNYTNPYEGYLFRLTFVLFFLKLALTKYDKKQWFMIAVSEAAGFISYRVTGKNDVIRIVTFVFACKDIPVRQMVKYAFYVTFTGCVAIVLLSLSGIYGSISLTQNFGRDNNVYDLYNGASAVTETRYTLGMGHPNALACMFLMLAAMGIYVYGEKLKWYAYLFIMLLNIGIYRLTDSKTTMLLAGALTAGACMMRYCRFLRERAFCYVCGLLVFCVCIAFSVDAAANARRVRDAQWNKYYYSDYRDNAHIAALAHIDDQITGRIQSLTNSENNDGTLETWKAFSDASHMDYYFDMGWVKLFYRYGVIPGVLYCAANIMLLWYFYKKRDAYGLVVFTVLAVYTVMEAHLFSIYIGRNFLLMMMGSCLCESGRTGKCSGKEAYDAGTDAGA